MPFTFTSRFFLGLLLTIALFTPLFVPVISQTKRAEALHVEQFLRRGRELVLADDDIRRRQDVARRRGPTKRQLDAIERLRRRIPGLEVRFDQVTGVPRHLFSLAQRLTPPRSGDPVRIAREFLASNKALFRLTEEEIGDLVVAKRERTAHNGVTHLVFKQFYRGLDVFQGHIKVNVDREGRILSVSGRYFPGLVALLRPDLDVSRAVQLAAAEIAPDVAFTPVMKRPATGIERATLFERGPFTDDVEAKLVIFPARDRARLAWKVRLHLMDRLAWYDVLVDAQTSEILFRHNLYKFSDPRGLVFAVNPDLGSQVLKSFNGDAVASPSTWVWPLPNVGTQGNNVITLPLARDAEQHFLFPFQNIYNTDGPNLFDLDGRTLRFTPNGAGGYDVSLLPVDFDADLGRDFTSRIRPDRDDGSAILSLGFSFPFFGSSFNTVFINANGNVTFNGGSRDASESWADMILSVPRIAVLWDDLDLSHVPEGGGLFVKRESARVVITWHRVSQFGLTDSNTVQLRLSADGVIEIAYNGVELTDGLVGITPGGGAFDLRPVDFSAQAPLSGLHVSLAEKFPTVELDAAITNLFYHLNFMHDYLYRLGFDEAAGNFQLDNFGRGGLDGDPVLAAPQHSGFNNAFFGAPEDGRSAFTGYFFFTAPPFRQVDSAFDADVIYHEYVHGLTTRLVGNRFDAAALFGRQSAAMGEGWSDIYSVSITNDPVTGEYSTGDPEVGIRTVNYASSPLVYGDFGNRLGPLTRFGIEGGIALDHTFIPEVHFDGEIWASTLWDLRSAVGKQTFEQLITDALKFTPSQPSMLDGRDALLIADLATYGGAHQAAIWTVFAARGMGVSARTDSGDDTVVLQTFDTPWNPLPPGRETIFFDDMNADENGWTVEGEDGQGGPALWHLSNRRGRAWYYGREDTGNYDTGARNFGALTSPVIDLPSIPSSSAIILEFDHFFRGSLFSSLTDNGYIRIIDVASGEIKQKAIVSDNTVGFRGGEFFQHEAIDISEFAGRSIQIQFYFDTINERRNDAEGWYIDNVRVSRRVP